MAKKRFSPKQNFTKTNIKKIPKEKPIIYELLNSKGKNIYTGKAKKGRVQGRLMEHLPGKPDSKKGSKTFRIKQMKSIKEAGKEEKIIIQKDKPKYNKKK